MEELKLKDLTVNQIFNCLAIIKDLQDKNIIDFDINKPFATFNYNEATKYLEKQNLELQQRIDKAIEYIEEHKEPLHHSFDEPDCDYWIATNPDDLLDILIGEDNEENNSI